MVELIKVKTDSSKMNLYCIGDFHIGSVGFKETELRTIVSKIKRDPLAKVIVMGDLCDSITPLDRRYDSSSKDENYATVQEQYLGIKNILEPIKDKILVILQGNHDEVIWDKAELNIPELMAIDFKTKYADDFALVTAKIGNATHRIVATHGSGGARSFGGHFDRIKKVTDIFEFTPDIVAMGHFHRVDSVVHCVLDENLKPKNKFLGFTGGFLQGYVNGGKTYVSKVLMQPLPIGCIMFELNSDGTVKDNKILM
jgi:hypothetical protein